MFVVKEIFTNGQGDNDYTSIQDLYNDNGDEFELAKLDPVNDLFLMPYSSGTTGVPKGVKLTHFNMLHPVIATGFG